MRPAKCGSAIKWPRADSDNSTGVPGSRYSCPPLESALEASRPASTRRPSSRRCWPSSSARSSQLEEKKTSIGKQKSLFGDLDGLLNKLTDAARAAEDDQRLPADDRELRTTRTILTASGDSSATPGTYTAVEVLATGQVADQQQRAAARPATTIGLAIRLRPRSSSRRTGSSFRSPRHPTRSRPSPTAINAADEQNDLGLRAEVDRHPEPGPVQPRISSSSAATETGSENAFDIIYDDVSRPTFQGFIDDLNQVRTETAHRTRSCESNGSRRLPVQTNTINDLCRRASRSTSSQRRYRIPDRRPTAKRSPSRSRPTPTETSTKITDLVEAYNEVVDFFAGAERRQRRRRTPRARPVRRHRHCARCAPACAGSSAARSPKPGNPAFQLLSQIGIDSDTRRSS